MGVEKSSTGCLYLFMPVYWFILFIIFSISPRRGWVPFWGKVSGLCHFSKCLKNLNLHPNFCKTFHKILHEIEKCKGPTKQHIIWEVCVYIEEWVLMRIAKVITRIMYKEWSRVWESRKPWRKQKTYMTICNNT